MYHCPSVWALEPLLKPKFYGCLAQLGHVPPPGFLKETPFCHLQLNKGSRCAKEPKSKILSYADKLHHLIKSNFFPFILFPPSKESGEVAGEGGGNPSSLGLVECSVYSCF